MEFSAGYQFCRFQLLFNSGFLFYAEYNLRLFFKLLRSKKDILFANDLDTLLPNFLVSRLTSCKLIYDSHEYFTEVPELVNRPRTRAFWQALERSLFPKLKNVMTVNRMIADAYREKYGNEISVVRNFPKRSTASSDQPIAPRNKVHKIILYQGSLNKGRGLELMIDAMPYLKDHMLVLAGEGDISEQLRKRVAMNNLGKKVLFKGKIRPDELSQLTRQADIGISLEEDLGLNYRYCLPNKVFDYIQAGVPILVSDLPLLKEIVRSFQLGEVLTKRDPMILAETIENMMLRKAAYKQGLKDAASRFNWEREKKILIEFIQNIE
jgi:glycosyltransferase involved in cell wall biosynthesis